MNDFVVFGIGVVIALLVVFAFRKPLMARRKEFMEKMKKKNK